MASVLALLANPNERDRMESTLRDRATVTSCENEAELLHAASHAGEGDVAIVALRDAHGHSLVAAVEALREQHPALPIYAYSVRGQEDVEVLVRAAHARIEDVVLYSAAEAWIALDGMPGGSDSEAVAQRVVRMTDRMVPAPARALFRAALIHVHSRATVDALATACGIHRKTLAARLKHAGLPATHEVVGWARLLCAVYWREEMRCTVEEAAYQSGFGAAAAFRGMLKRYTQWTPTQLHEVGGFRVMFTPLAAAFGTSAEAARAVAPSFIRDSRNAIRREGSAEPPAQAQHARINPAGKRGVTRG